MDYKGVIVGLGNPGAKYDHTRHNCGFDFVSYLVELAARDGEASQQNGGKFSCELWRLRLPKLGGLWLAAKPQTFMNLSGQCVQPLLAWHKLKPHDLVVVHDELDIDPGTVRVKFGGGHAGHNGLRSICDKLGTRDWFRVRIGIGRPPGRKPVVDWVLSRPRSKDDTEAFDHAVSEGADAVLCLIDNGLEKTQQKFN